MHPRVSDHNRDPENTQHPGDLSYRRRDETLERRSRDAPIASYMEVFDTTTAEGILRWAPQASSRRAVLKVARTNLGLGVLTRTDAEKLINAGYLELADELGSCATPHNSSRHDVVAKVS